MTDRGPSSTAPLGAAPGIAASKLIGTSVVNTADEKVGDIKEVILGDDGAAKLVVIGVGGVLGVGERNVAMPWDNVKLTRDRSNALQAQVSYTKDQLKQLPEFRLSEVRRPDTERAPDAERSTPPSTGRTTPGGGSTMPPGTGSTPTR